MTSRILLIACLVGLSPIRDAAGQTSPGAPRADATGLVGWLNVHEDDLNSYNEWYNRLAYGGALTGLYWTEHLKTEMELGVSSTGKIYAPVSTQVGAQVLYTTARYRFSSRRAAFSQQYQFFENAWFHPHLGAGVDVAWENSRRDEDPVYAYDPASPARLVRPARISESETKLRVRPAASVGFKAYMTQRAFFRSDVRVVFRRGVDEVSLRFGFGADF